MFKISTGLANHLMASGSLKAGFDGKVIRIYSGPEPASANAALTLGTTHMVLCVLSKDGGGQGLKLDGTPVSGIIKKDSDEVWRGTIVANGVASFFRVGDVNDTDEENPLLVRMQGSVGTVNADFLVSNVTMVAGEEQRCDSCNIGIPVGA